MLQVHEGSCTCEQLKQGDAQSPDVHLLITRLDVLCSNAAVADHLYWRQLHHLRHHSPPLNS